MDSKARNMYVFRDGRRSEPGRTLVEALAAELHSLPAEAARAPRNHLVSALMRAGELESSLGDAASPDAARVACITDYCAAALIASARGGGCCGPTISPGEVLDHLPQAIPEKVTSSPPEGFAYYALQPLDFVDLAERVPLCSSTPTPGALGGPLSEKAVGVVGIRSIGTTLSALVLAALQRRGMRGERITVRPTGHPYDRHTEFSREQGRWVAAQRAREAEFLVVDEGPGMSGSSFLSVGEALLSTGVAREHVRLLCSRQPNVDMLCARNARERWLGFHAYYAEANSHLPPDAKIYVGGGFWRQYLCSDPSCWPASWIQMERLKFLTSDKRELFKFEGLGRFGAEVHRRAQVLAEAGFAPPPLEFSDGFGRYPMAAGRMLCAADASPELLEHMAAYCAFRATALRSTDGQQPEALEEMLRFNVHEEFGIDLDQAGPFYAASPVIVDGRMLPHEWLRTSDGTLLKLDGTSHGDDHFFPGPTDIAWDLAGAIAEWGMDRGSAEYFLTHYQRRSGDDPRPRLPAYLLAYTVFRLAYCKMAADTARGSEEEHRLLHAYQHYRELALAQLPKLTRTAA